MTQKKQHRELDRVVGRLQWEERNQASKSEGRYAVLTTRDNVHYKLYRSGELPFNDSFFDSYIGHMVCVHGTIEEEGYLRIESIEVQVIF